MIHHANDKEKTTTSKFIEVVVEPGYRYYLDYLFNVIYIK